MRKIQKLIRRGAPEFRQIDWVKAQPLEMNFDARQKSRGRIVLQDGQAIALMLPRPTALGDGDLLCDEHGGLFRIVAAEETLSETATTDLRALARAAYHLGNRHVPLEVDAGRLRWVRDPVLDSMVRALGLPVCAIDAPFHPEPGAYAGGHSHRPTVLNAEEPADATDHPTAVDDQRPLRVP